MSELNRVNTALDFSSRFCPKIYTIEYIGLDNIFNALCIYGQYTIISQVLIQESIKG
jgi:hypothetical protein